MEKKVMKFITVDNFEKEEEFLKDMSLKGWHFSRYEGLKYFFEKGPTRNFEYRLDYHSDDEGDKDEYLQLFEDSGWESVFTYSILDGDWCYFRKEVNENENMEIFTDNTSKIELFKKIRLKWGLFGFMYSLLFLPIMFLVASSDYIFITLLVVTVGAALVLLYSKLVLNITKKIRDLRG